VLVPILITLLILAAVLLVALRSAYDVRVMRDTLTSPLVPPAFDGATIVFLADVHAGRFLGRSRVSSLVDLVQSEDPSLIILGGDYVGGRTNGARHFYPEVSRLDAPLGVVAVLGNHDSWEGDHDERHELAAAGITVLENEAIRVAPEDPGSGALVVAGLADEWTGTPDVDAVRDSVGPQDYGILVAHNPDSLGPALHDESLWSLALAGHTHGGQFRGIYELLPHKPMEADARYLSGWTHEAGTEVLVSNGVGVVTLPLRMFAPAQIHVITLCHDPAGAVVSDSE
jgi:uncharacterized protein